MRVGKEIGLCKLHKENERTKVCRFQKNMIQKIYFEIQKQIDKHSVSELCGIYGISRSGYYMLLKRDGQNNCCEKTNQILEDFVSDIHA